MAREEIWAFHKNHGFPSKLVTNVTNDHLKTSSLDEKGHGYEDYGNWSGSIVMYAMFFAYSQEESLLDIFDKTKERRHVYQHWGEEGQRSGTGPDNTRTNLLESILNNMGPRSGRYTQRAWEMVYLYYLQYPNLNRQQLLVKALNDKVTTVINDDYLTAKGIAFTLCQIRSPDFLQKAAKLFEFVRTHGISPDYWEICKITGCSNKNAHLKSWYWRIANEFLMNSLTNGCF